jgi:hypothetical protein
LKRSLWLPTVAIVLLSVSGLSAPPQEQEEIQDITGKYHFLSADDTLGVLEQEGKLKGYVDVYQGEEESDTILSYPINVGERKKNHVEFKTGKIHRRYYRFSGTVERGKGHEEGDPDYLRLVGDVEVVAIKADSGEEAVQRMHVVLKSFGKAERVED